MPTEYLHRLTVEGPEETVRDFEADDAVLELREHLVADAAAEILSDRGMKRVVYRYDDNWKVPAPSVADLAARFPKLTMCQESCDEFGESAYIIRYSNGSEIDETSVDPSTFAWLEWEKDV